MDVLTREQLQEQLKKREAWVEKLIKDCASPRLIDTAKKDLLLTRRRLERLQNADYEEDIADIQMLGEINNG